MNRFEKLKKIWGIENTTIQKSDILKDLELFQSINNLIVPQELLDYFILLNGTNGDYDQNFFNFYPLSEFMSIDEELKNWKGIPDYSNIVNTLDNYKSYFVFADYNCHMFSYAIKLHSYESTENQILVICGDEYKVIAHSFLGFLDLYFSDDIGLQL